MADDPHIPLLLWWAVEQHAVADLDDTLARFTSPAAWRVAMIRSTILGRLVRRLAAEKNLRGDSGCARVLGSAPSLEARKPLLFELNQAMSDRDSATVAPLLAHLLLNLADHQSEDPILTTLAARLGSRAAIQRARAISANDRAPNDERLAMLDLLGELRDQSSVQLFLDLTTQANGANEAVLIAAFKALGHFHDPSIASTAAGSLSAKRPGLAFPCERVALEPHLVGTSLPGGGRSGDASGWRRCA